MRRLFVFALVLCCLSLVGLSADVTLVWDPSPSENVDGYNIYRSTTSATGYAKLNPSLIVGVTYTDTTAAEGVTYYYVATAERDSLESGYSNEVNVQIPYSTAPEPPGNLQGTVQTALNWSPSDGADHYVIYRRDASTGWDWEEIAQTTELAYLDTTGLAPSQYRVVSIHAEQQSEPATLFVR